MNDPLSSIVRAQVLRPIIIERYYRDKSHYILALKAGNLLGWVLNTRQPEVAYDIGRVGEVGL